MIVHGPIGRVDDCAADIDWLDLNWQQTLRRALRLTTRAGTRVDLLLPPGGRIAHGDALHDGPPRIAVCIETIDVLRIRGDGAERLAQFAFALGNLHIAAQFRGGDVLTIDDGPTRALVAEHELSADVIAARFYPEPVLLTPPLSSAN